MDVGRRRFLKGTAAAGAVAWTTPVVTTIGLSVARGTPACACSGRAFGLSTTRNGTTVLYGDTGEDSVSKTTCPNPVNAPGPANPTVTATNACGTLDFDTAPACFASATIDDLVVNPNPGPETTITGPAGGPVTVSVSAPCDCTAATFTTVAGITVSVVNAPTGGPITTVTRTSDGSEDQTFPAFTVAEGMQIWTVNITFNKTTVAPCPTTDPPRYSIEAVNMTLTRMGQNNAYIAGSASVAATNCVCP